MGNDSTGGWRQKNLTLQSMVRWQEVQKDSTVKFRFIFLRPNINKDLKKNFIIIPLQGKTETLHLELKKGK